MYGTVYVADTGNHTIRAINSLGTVFTVAGRAGVEGSVDGRGAGARFASPSGLAVAPDWGGYILVADAASSTIRRVSPVGAVTTVGGLAYTPGSQDGAGGAARFSNPAGIAITAAAQLYVSSGHSIVLGAGSPAVSVALTQNGVELASGSTVDWGDVGAFFSSDRSFTLTNTGTAPLTNFILSVDSAQAWEWSAYLVFPPISLAPGEITYFTVSFNPGVLGPHATTLHLHTNDPVVPTFQLALTGNGVDLPPALSVDIRSDNADLTWARVGNTITVSFQSNESLQPPTVLIAGRAATVTGSFKNWSATLPVTADLPQGAVAFSITAQDLTGHVTTVTTPTNQYAGVTIDTIAPGLAQPADLFIQATSRGGAQATYSAYSSDKIAAIFSPPSGSAFRLGPTLVTATAKDAAGNTTSRTFIVTVVDTSPPILSYPAHGLTVEATGPAGALVNFAVGANDIVDGVRPVSATAASGSLFPIGTTTVSLSASDTRNNTASASFTVTVQDTVKPVLVQPSNIIVEVPRPQGANVTYPPARASDLVGPVTVSYSMASGSLFPVGTTRVFVTATDGAGNSSATLSFTVTVRDTTPPVITGSFYPRILLVGDLVPDYLAEATFTDASAIIEKTQNPAAGTQVSYFQKQVTLTARDASGNQGTTSFPLEVRNESQRNELQSAFLPGSLVNPAGTPGGPPSDARFVSLGDPAVDDAGTVAATSWWVSPTVGRGNSASGFSGGLTTGATLIPGAAYVGAVGDPVIDGGHVAALGSLRRVGAPTVAAIFDQPAGGALSFAMRGLNEAPDTGGATFKSFTQVGVAGSSLAFVGQLALNTGSPRTSAGSDTGVWARDATHPLKLLLREGQAVGGKLIKTLVTFHPGNDSPGQGRGWVLNLNGVTQIHALVTFGDGTQALLAADNTGRLTRLSSTGPLGAGRPTLSGASFASYSFPALNALGDHAFLGTLTVGAAGVTRATSRGIFLNNPATGTYDAVVRVGDRAPYAIGSTSTDSATFSTLYDPVLQDDGSVAFRALLAGVRPGNHDSLWWQPAGGALKLLAQEGQPAGIIGPQWVSFDSVAIRPQGGPLFTATISDGTSGVWALDYTGHLHKLFRTGDTIGVKPLAGFTILKALPGTMGMTRSFNGTQLLVWRATFKDGTTGIVETVVP